MLVGCFFWSLWIDATLGRDPRPKPPPPPEEEEAGEDAEYYDEEPAAAR